MILLSFFYSLDLHPDLHSFPTRRSSDLDHAGTASERVPPFGSINVGVGRAARLPGVVQVPLLGIKGIVRRQVDVHAIIGDRKSTRLNSSHLGISYAVFCLKKKRPIISDI